MLNLHVLASGSKGNAAVVEDASTGHGVLIDCGICRRDFLARCAEARFDPAKLDAILVTHEHSDHTRCLGVVARAVARLGSAVPVYALEPVMEASGQLRDLRGACELTAMHADVALRLGGIAVVPFPTSHDAAASCGFRFESDDGDALGYVTDTGCTSVRMLSLLENVRVLALEANHDETMLAEGDYPYHLKRRISSDAGHLSNGQAAEALGIVAGPRLERVVAMHLSQNNNAPARALAALSGALEAAGSPAAVSCASQDALTTTADLDERQMRLL